mgnify:CR=1 FL=1
MPTGKLGRGGPEALQALLDQVLKSGTSAVGGVKSAASRAWDAMLNLGREDSTEQKLADLRKKLALKLDRKSVV